MSDFWYELGQAWQNGEINKQEAFHHGVDPPWKDETVERLSDLSGDSLFIAECLKCNHVRENVGEKELGTIVRGENACSQCGSVSAWWIKPAIHAAVKPTEMAIKREMERFDSALESWMLTPQGQAAQVFAERDRKGT